MRYTCIIISLIIIYLFKTINLEKVNATKINIDVRSAKSASPDIYQCIYTLDKPCLLDAADNFINKKQIQLLAEADRRVQNQAIGRGMESTPSQLYKTINKLFSQLSDIVRDNVSGYFFNGKSSTDDNEIDDEQKFSKSSVGEGRLKKKKQRLVNLIKFLIIGGVIKAKIKLLLKALAVGLQVKFFLVALGGLLLNAARFYLDLKKGHSPQKVIYYEHAQHQHHYDGAEDDWGGSSGSTGGYWGRAYDVGGDDKLTAQNLAYAKQKPTTYTKVEGKPNNSWLIY